MLDIQTPAYFGQVWIKGTKRYTVSGVQVTPELWAVHDPSTGILLGHFSKGTAAADAVAAALRADGWKPLSAGVL